MIRSNVTQNEQRKDFGAVLRECVAVLMSQPRSWNAYQAQLVLDDLEADYDTFRTLAVDNLAQGDFAVGWRAR